MHAILATIGTDGDVFPYLGLGAKLLAHGHRVTLATHEPFRARAEAHGFAFRSFVSDEETQSFLNHPDTWHPLKGPAFLGALGSEIDRPPVRGSRRVGEGLGRTLDRIARRPRRPSRSGKNVTPVGVHRPSTVDDSQHVRPATHARRPYAAALGARPLGRLYWRGVDAVGAMLMGGSLQRACADLGLPPVPRIFQWWLSPQRILGLFPEWYGNPQADWPPHLRMTGFPLYDGNPHGGLSPEVQTFCQEGTPPVAFTFGTGMMHGTRLFQAAIDACLLIVIRGLLLTKYERQLPSSLPPFVRRIEFEPFRKLFPHCAAVVHHGGIGTTAQGAGDENAAIDPSAGF